MLFSTTGMVKRAYNMLEEVNLFFVIKNKNSNSVTWPKLQTYFQLYRASLNTK